jgi:hypothetical protein
MSGTEFRNNVEMRNFAYAKAIGLGESIVKEAVGAYLRARGYEVFVGQPGERGADIRATKNGLPLIIEAKGEGSRDPMYNNFFLHALGEIIQRMRENAAEYGRGPGPSRIAPPGLRGCTLTSIGTARNEHESRQV